MPGVMDGRRPVQPLRYGSMAGLILLALAPGRASHAQARPLWEAGIGIAALRLPDYRGSDQARNYLLPFPYLIYRGRILKVDRKGVRGQLLHTDRVTSDVSLGAAVPVYSRRSDARQGMPNLEPTLEIGPSLSVLLARDETAHRSLTLNLPLRAVIATNFRHVHGEGWVFSPNLNLDQAHIGPGRAWNLGISIGPLFADRQYHSYYYTVAPAYATAARPAYAAPGGYSGSRLTLALSRRYQDLWFGAFLRYDDLAGAAFENSPLVKQKYSLMAGFGVAWIFARSTTLVERRDHE